MALFGLIGKKKTAAQVVKEGKEIKGIEKAEERLEREEIKLVKQALDLLKIAFQGTSYGTPDSQQYGVAIKEQQYAQDLGRRLGYVETTLLNIRTYGERVEKLAERLERDLLDIRNSTKDRRLEHLSGEEIKALDYTKAINKNLQEVITLVKKVKEYDFKQIIHQGGYNLTPKNKELGATIKSEFEAIHRGLDAIYKHLLNLFDLETQVELLTAKYVKT